MNKVVFEMQLIIRLDMASESTSLQNLLGADDLKRKGDKVETIGLLILAQFLSFI